MNTRAAVATFGEIARNGLGVPLLVMVVLAMMVLPLPAFLLDVFFTFNISLSLMILLAVIYVRRALEFATFPTVLLGATLLRQRVDVQRAGLRQRHADGQRIVVGGKSRRRQQHRGGKQEGCSHIVSSRVPAGVADAVRV